MLYTLCGSFKRRGKYHFAAIHQCWRLAREDTRKVVNVIYHENLSSGSLTDRDRDVVDGISEDYVMDAIYAAQGSRCVRVQHTLSTSHNWCNMVSASYVLDIRIG